jgi:hypothetical protein
MSPGATIAKKDLLFLAVVTFLVAAFAFPDVRFRNQEVRARQ